MVDPRVPVFTSCAALWSILTFTDDFNLSEPVEVVHVGPAFPLDVHSVPAAVVALNHPGVELALSRPSNAFLKSMFTQLQC